MNKVLEQVISSKEFYTLSSLRDALENIGFVIVPIEPTEKMLNAAKPGYFRARYIAMIKAAT